jgi:protein O-mannosyl-transferase
MNLPTSQEMETPAPPRGTEEERPLLAKVAVGLALLTFLIFLPVVEYEFVNYDDDVFVTNNPKVAPGFTWEGIKWAFTSADIDYWRPLSWLSHMLDIELFGPAAGGHHLSNLLIHCAAVALCLLALHRLTGAVWRSAMVAALFAWHPLHVESVAWIAERKDVLCGLFWFATIWLYAGYARHPTSKGYLLVFAGFILAIMSKPMAVTLPCVLLLLDFWPLNRVRVPEQGGWTQEAVQSLGAALFQLGREKIPFFAVVLVMSLSAVESQHQVGTLSDIKGVPPIWRIQNATFGYATYLAQTFVPANLCVLYPFTPGRPWTEWLPAGLLLLATSCLGLMTLRRHPYQLVGWLWFLGVLVPVIGLVQVGEQAHADRYTYLPLTGLFLAIVWTVGEIDARQPNRTHRWAIGGGAVLLLCAGLTRQQLRHWENGVTLFSRAALVTERNPTAHNNLGSSYRGRDQYLEAIPHFYESLRIREDQRPLLNLTYTYAVLGSNELAIAHARKAFGLDPHSWISHDAYKQTLHNYTDLPVGHRILAAALASRHKYLEAAQRAEQAFGLDPQNPAVRLEHAAYLALANKLPLAIQSLEQALATAPTNTLVRANLAALLAKEGRLMEALDHYEQAIAQDPGNFATRHNRAILLFRSGKLQEAKQEFLAVLKRAPSYWPAMQQLAWLHATDPSQRDAKTAVEYATRALALVGRPSPLLLNTLGAAQAAAGDFSAAIESAQAALRLARQSHSDELLKTIYNCLEAYNNQRPASLLEAIPR